MSFPRYPEYKDCGQDWIGVIPSHWSVIPLAKIASGPGALFIDGDWVESKDLADGGVRYITTGNVGEGRYKEQGSGYISQAKFDELRCTEVLPGDVLISRLNLPIGRACVVPDLGERIITSVDNVITRPDSSYSRSYLAYMLSSASHFANMEILARGTTMQRISRSTLGRVRFAFPPAEEQTSISTFLNHETAKIDALVAEQERLIELLKEKRQAVISHAVTKGLDPSMPMKNSGVEWLGDVPAHWALRPLKSLAKFRSGGTPDKRTTDYWDGDIPWASAKDLKVDQLLDTIDHITQLALDDGAATLVPAEAVVVVVRGMILARYFPVTTLKRSMAINQDLKALLPSNEVDAGYLAWLLRASEPETLNCLDEAGHGTKALRMENWGGMTVPLPPVREQAAISAALEAATGQLDSGFAELEQAISLLQERRTALISAAVTGQIDVRGWVPAETAA
jgi:type I restriction enzyme S subunit